MKQAKLLKFDKQARNKLLKGVNIISEAVGSTLGPKGRNVAINNKFTAPTVIHDGVSVARAINLVDPFQDMGAELVKEAAQKTNDTAGDGTTTATILAQAIINKGMENIQAGANPMTLKAEIQGALKLVLKELKQLGRTVSNDNEVEQIATISSADPLVGKLVAEAIKKVGKDGSISVDEGHGLVTEVEYKQGMEFDRGYISPYFVTDQKTVEATLKDPYILVTDNVINQNSQMLVFMEKFLKAGLKDLVIIAGDVSGEALNTLVLNKLRAVVNVVCIQAPAFGDRRKDEVEDIATLVGATVILEDSGRSFDTVELSELGRAGKVVADRDKTIILDGKGDKKAVFNRMSDLRAQMEVANTGFDKDIKQERLSKLAGGVAVINVGAATEIELKDKKERVIDAVNATKAAIEEGIVAGGEISLLEIAQKPFWDTLGGVGSQILREALKQPFSRLVTNAGLDYAEVWGQITPIKYPFGIDVMDGKKKDLIKAGIIDPVKVARCALENAVSVAVMAMTTNCLITDVEEK